MNRQEELATLRAKVERWEGKATTAKIRITALELEANREKYVMDDEHQGQLHSDTCGNAVRHEAVVAQGALTTNFDVGAW